MELGSADAATQWRARLAGSPFAAALAKGAPVFVACGDPPQVVFATAAALAAFGAIDAHALTAVLFAADSLGARRLRRLAAQTPAGGPPRLEMLRVFVARKPVSRSWLCARLTRDGATFFVAADVAAPTGEAPQEPVVAPPVAEPAVASPEASPRFVWRLDSDDRFGAPDAVLAQAVGDEAPRPGERLAALSARLGFDAAWSERVAARRTFSRLRVVWPGFGAGQGRVAWLSGAPLFAAGRTYQGFRGFGALTDEPAAVSRPPKLESPEPELLKPELPKPESSAQKPSAGDAAALLGLLQRQHPTAAPIASIPGAGNAPALAIISALAALLQPKPPAGEPKSEPRPAAKPAVPPPAPSSGAEIVVLRRHANAATYEALAARDSDSVALTSQERDAFKEIARALGANVRPGRPGGEAAPEPPTPAAAPGEDDLAALLDILPIAVLVLRDGEALYANRTLLDLVGFRDFGDFRAREGLKAIFRGRDPLTLASGGLVAGIPIIGAGERILTVDAQVRAAHWAGAPAALVAMRRSREAEHQAELRAIERETTLHAARARDFAAALEAARDGMVRFDRNGRILGMNRGAEKLFGYDQREAAGESFLTLLAPASQAAAAAALERLTRGEGGPVEALEAVARNHQGRLFPARLDLGRLANQPDPDFFLLLTDRTEAEDGANGARAALEGAKKESEAKTDLLSRVSHEMRTPLHAILGFAEVILEERFGPVGNERYRDYIRDIHVSGRHVLSLVNDLLDLTKIDLGKIELQFSPIDVNAAVRECVTLMQPQAARERVIMRLSLFDRLPNVMADERSLRQILLNLMANAVKYNEPGGQVIVSTALDEAGSVILRVRDTGVGMNESELAVALEPFRRVPGVRAVEGTGLGLPLAKALVEANHADFSIKSRKDQGTLVEIAFPVRRAAQ
ncbi:MAG TPA: ATP-binding protein [Roseiarcus sp.]|nr:ATP-binding protein [Roseiarcus sp.]